MDTVAGLDSLLEPLSLRLEAESARRLVAFRIDQPVQARIEMLGERANEGNLNTSERSEYEALINAADFIAILNSKPGGILTRFLNSDGCRNPAVRPCEGSGTMRSIAGFTKGTASSYITSGT
jgi:hypothetical protein